MTAARVAVLLAAAAFAYPSVAQERPDKYKQPTEAQCRQLVDQMVQTMKSTPPPGQRDKDVDALVARVEKNVADNRARGKSECDSWAYIVDAVTKN